MFYSINISRVASHAKPQLRCPPNLHKVGVRTQNWASILATYNDLFVLKSWSSELIPLISVSSLVKWKITIVFSSLVC